MDTGESFDSPIGESWLAIVHSIAESVGECESFLGSRYAAKLKSGLAKAVGSRIHLYVQGENRSMNLTKRKKLEMAICFVERILRVEGDEYFFSKASSLLNQDSRLLSSADVKEIDQAILTWSWLAECFVRL